MGAFAEATRWLKSRHPKLRVTVRRGNLPGDRLGDCSKLEKGRFHIRVSRALDEDAAVHILIHEWAHAVAWGKRGHDARWAIAFAELLEEWPQHANRKKPPPAER